MLSAVSFLKKKSLKKSFENSTKICLKLSKLKSQAGFTLIEIMIVLVILGGLMAILGKNVIDKLDKSRQKEAYIQIKELAKQLDTYNLDCSQYPTTDQGLQALIVNPGSESCPNWGPEAYLKNIPKDPWGLPFIYESDGTKFTLKSYGKDRKPGGAGYARDISSDDDDMSAAK